MLPPPFDPVQWTDTDLHRTLASLHLRFAWIVEGHDRVDGVPELAGELASLVTLTRPEAAERHELELAVVRGEALLRDAAGLVAGSLADPGGPGEVVGLFRGDGGVPKHPANEVTIGARGVEGDRQANRQHHGRVWQALCLWSEEVIDALRAEGHPIAPGNAGENVTVRGLDWAAVRPGLHLSLGDEVVVELTAYSTPCTHNGRWFADGGFSRIDHGRHPGSSRVYATVLRGGALRLGDAVTALR